MVHFAIGRLPDDDDDDDAYVLCVCVSVALRLIFIGPTKDSSPCVIQIVLLFPSEVWMTSFPTTCKLHSSHHSDNALSSG